MEAKERKMTMKLVHDRGFNNTHRLLLMRNGDVIYGSSWQEYDLPVMLKTKEGQVYVGLTDYFNNPGIYVRITEQETAQIVN